MIIPQEKWQKYLFAASIVKSCIDGVNSNQIHNCESTRKFFAAMFAQLIFNCPNLHSGLISPAGRLQMTPKKPATADHFRGRKGSGYVLFDQALKGRSLERLALILASRCRVHYISTEENNKLRLTASQNPYKTKKEIEQEYSRLNIVLEEFVPRVHRAYDYFIEDVMYTSVSEISKKYNLSTSGVINRCDSKYWPDWKRIKIE